MPHLADLKAGRLARDLAEATVFLTRVPVPMGPPRGIASAWSWPLVGAGLGLASAGAGASAMALGLGPGVAAGLVLATHALLTGALHEDGLADCVDGFWGGRTPERRLAIMRDSRVGSYGVLALVLVSLLRWSALSALLAPGPAWGSLVTAGALSRLAPLLLLHLPPARPSGLGAAAGRPSGSTIAVAAALGGILALTSVGAAGLAALLAVAAVAWGWGLVARGKIGGQTGDVCGAGQVLAEVAALLTLLALA